MDYRVALQKWGAAKLVSAYYEVAADQIDEASVWVDLSINEGYDGSTQEIKVTARTKAGRHISLVNKVTTLSNLLGELLDVADGTLARVMATGQEGRLPEGVDPLHYATYDWRTGKLHVPARYDNPDTAVAEVIGEDWQEDAIDHLVRLGYSTLGDWHGNLDFENSTILLRR